MDGDEANSFAGNMGWSKFVASQNFYSIASRDIEREIVPMALSEGISIMAMEPAGWRIPVRKIYKRYQNCRKPAGEIIFDFPPINKRELLTLLM